MTDTPGQAAARDSTGRGTRRQPRRHVDGVLLLDKPVGLSSNHALQRVKSLYAAHKAGHTGSLDPLASGLLPICLGQATKMAGYLLDAGKSYQFRLQFGAGTSTGDREGAVIAQGPSCIAEDQLLKVLADLRTTIQQVPPMYSALKHQGQPLYELARAGKSVPREPRPVTIFELNILTFDPTAPVLLTQCSKGTYIRSLAEEIAARLGTVAHVVELRRLASGPFAIDQAVGLAQLQQLAERGYSDLDGYLLAPDAAVVHLPRLDLTGEQAQRLMHGQGVQIDLPVSVDVPLRLYGAAREFLGVGCRDQFGRLAARRLMAH